MFVCLIVMSFSKTSIYSAVNLLLNPSFETGSLSNNNPIDLQSTGGLIGWVFSDYNRSGGTYSYANDYSVDPAIQTPFGQRFLNFGNGSFDVGNGLTQLIYDNGIGVNPLNSGLYNFSIYAKRIGISNANSVHSAFLVEIINGNGYQNFYFGRALGVSEEWTQYSMEFNLDTPMTISLSIRDASYGSSDSNDILLDNAFLQGVPEPSALSLLAFGLGGLALNRRRRSHLLP